MKQTRLHRTITATLTHFTRICVFMTCLIACIAMYILSSFHVSTLHLFAIASEERMSYAHSAFVAP